jgi:sterol desaturase/sphingolipid hydroxylase (fatty acid hydroxylase superfamily)
MTAWLLAYEGWVKLGVALALLALLGLLQLALPRRGDGRSAQRWRSNLGLIALSTLALRLLIPVSGTAFALWLQGAGTGIFNRVGLAEGIEFGAAIVLLDLAIYWQHRAFHHFPLLWRAHRVHHSDTAFDVSLGLRFHPFEILPSMLYKLAVVAVLGASPVAVLSYEAALLAFSLMTHADLALPAGLDRALRLVFVTPDWHRVHHSVHGIESNSNYGNILSVWDRLFGTAIGQPRHGHVRMEIGLRQLRSAGDQTLAALLRQPFRNPPIPDPDSSHA